MAMRRAVTRAVHGRAGTLRAVPGRRPARQRPPERVQTLAPALHAHILGEAHVVVDHTAHAELSLQTDVDPDGSEQLPRRTSGGGAVGKPLHHVLAGRQDRRLRLLGRQIRPELAKDRAAELVHVGHIGETFEEL
jgi:hypothetical protein